MLTLDSRGMSLGDCGGCLSDHSCSLHSGAAAPRCNGG
jgi:hypothetical protein